MPSLDLRQPRQFLFCKVEFYLQRHYTHTTSRAHPLRLAKLYHAKPLDNILQMEYIVVLIITGTGSLKFVVFRALH